MTDERVYRFTAVRGDPTVARRTEQTTLDDYGTGRRVIRDMEEVVRSFRGASKVRDPFPSMGDMIFDENYRCNEYVHLRNGTEFAKELRTGAIQDPQLRAVMDQWIAQAGVLYTALSVLIEREKAEPKFCYKGPRMPEEGEE